MTAQHEPTACAEQSLKLSNYYVFPLIDFTVKNTHKTPNKTDATIVKSPDEELAPRNASDHIVKKVKIAHTTERVPDIAAKTARSICMFLHLSRAVLHVNTLPKRMN
ncbi:hypothetical protein [Deinococcus sp. UYEF24]